MMAWQFKPLQFGNCMSCGKQIYPGESGWHNYEIHRVRCANCGCPDQPAEIEKVVSESTTVTRDPIGGSSLLRDADSVRDPFWKRNSKSGAAAEYIVDRSLHDNLTKGSIILNDRQLPGLKTNIDHIVVASSGVWIIDTKNWKGKIEYKTKNLRSLDMRLFVNGRDETSAAEEIYSLVIPVAQIIDDRSVPLNAALTFPWGDWSVPASFRLNFMKPYQHNDVWLTARRSLAKLINAPGPLSHHGACQVF